jgi:hypothetical protein
MLPEFKDAVEYLESGYDREMKLYRSEDAFGPEGRNDGLALIWTPNAGRATKRAYGIEEDFPLRLSCSLMFSLKEDG